MAFQERYFSSDAFLQLLKSKQLNHDLYICFETNSLGVQLFIEILIKIAEGRRRPLFVPGATKCNYMNMIHINR